MLWLPVARQGSTHNYACHVCHVEITPVHRCAHDQVSFRAPSRCLRCFLWAREKRCDAAKRERDTLRAGVG